MHVVGENVMANMTIRVPEDLKRRMDRHREINWSEVARKSFQEYINKLELAEEIASKSELTPEDAEELSRKIKHGVAEHYR